MPANLPPQYYELERTFKAERDPREKLRLAQELLAMMPKHKGTDKLQAEMKAKISKLKKQIDSGQKKGGGPSRTEQPDHIDKEGAGQVVFIGPPNSGKSSLLDALTNAKPLVADYPFTTREPQAGMMPYETISIQLVDTPPISPDLFETYLLGIIRNADLICTICDVGDTGCENGVRFVFDKLAERRVVLVPEIPKAEDIEDPSLAYKKTILVAHKIYDEQARPASGRDVSRFYRRENVDTRRREHGRIQAPALPGTEYHPHLHQGRRPRPRLHRSDHPQAQCHRRGCGDDAAQGFRAEIAVRQNLGGG